MHDILDAMTSSQDESTSAFLDVRSGRVEIVLDNDFGFPGTRRRTSGSRRS